MEHGESHVCRTCGLQLLKGINWYNSSAARHENICIACARRYGRERRKTHPTEQKAIDRKRYLTNHVARNAYGRIHRRDRKAELFKRLGQKCVTCGEMILTFLTMSAINDDHHEISLQIFGETKASDHLFDWLINNNYPTDVMSHFQTECFNCNYGRAFRGYLDIPEANLTSTHRLQKMRLLKCIEYFGGGCTCCGIYDPHVLTLGHKHNDGASDRRGGLPIGSALYKFLVATNFPLDVVNKLQLECFNCNVGKKCNGGICPHAQINIGAVP